MIEHALRSPLLPPSEPCSGKYSSADLRRQNWGSVRRSNSTLEGRNFETLLKAGFKEEINIGMRLHEEGQTEVLM